MIRMRHARSAGVLAALALGAVCVPSPRTAMAVGTLGTDAPDLVYDAIAGAGSSVVAGATNYLIQGDFNGDGYPDVVNVTSRGVQVFLNQGTVGGHLTLDLAQEHELGFSQGGGAVDYDHDHDLDLVLGSVTHLVVGKNDGTGHFTFCEVLEHDFRQPTVAVPFLSRGDLHASGNRVRVAIGASAETVANDLLGANPSHLPYMYVLEYDAGGHSWSVLQQLDHFNLEGVAAADVDGDGDTDLVAPDRSGLSPHPIYGYIDTGAPYAPYTAFDLTNYVFTFGFGPAIAPTGDVAVGSWHRTAIFPRAGGYPGVWQTVARTGASESLDAPGGTVTGLTDHRDGDFGTALHVENDGDPDAVQVSTFEHWDVSGLLPQDFRFHVKLASGTDPSSVVDFAVWNWSTSGYDVLVHAGDGAGFAGPSGLVETTVDLGSDYVGPSGEVDAHAVVHASGAPTSSADYYESVLEHRHVDPVSWGTPTYVSLDPLGVYTTGEAFAQQFADMDGDGHDDLVAVGRTTPLELIHLIGDPNDLGNRFHAPVTPGTNKDLQVADWDQDVHGAADVLTGGSQGLWFYRNANGGSVGTPAAPPTPTAGEETLLAWYELIDLLDPANPDPLGADDPTVEYAPGMFLFDDAARAAGGHAVSDLAAIDPEYILHGTIFGASDAERVETLRSYWLRVAHARADVAFAASRTSDAADLARLLSIDVHLADAQAAITLQAFDLFGAVVPKSGTARVPRKAQRLMHQALRARDTMQDALAAAHIAEDPADVSDSLGTVGAESRRALDRLHRYARIMDRRNRRRS